MASAVKIRASSLSDLFDCPARWESIHIHKKNAKRSPRAQLGTAVHASTAVFDKSTLDGAGITPDEAAGSAVDAIQQPEEDVDWSDEKPSDIEPIALALHHRYCNDVAPFQRYVAVEVQCDALEISDLGIVLTGTTDRIYQSDDGGYGVGDIKTGKNAVKKNGTVATKGHAYQIGTYELLAQYASKINLTEPGKIFGLNSGKTAVAQRTGIAQVVGARDILLGDGDTPGVLQRASKIIHSGDFWGNPRSMLCEKKYCPIYNTCSFRK